MIIAGPDRYTRAFQDATQTIPIVAMSEDLVADGLIASLAQPGGNITGISILSPELDTAKRLDYLIEAVPERTAHRALFDPTVRRWRTHRRGLRGRRTRPARGAWNRVLFGVPQRDRVIPSDRLQRRLAGAGASIFLAIADCSPSMHGALIIEHVTSDANAVDASNGQSRRRTAA